MSSLGLGLVAANEYFKEGDRQQQRDRDAQRFEWERQKAQSELSTMPSLADATRTGAQLRSKQNTANLGLVDLETDLKRSKVALEQGDVTNKIDLQPTQQSTAIKQAEIASTLADFQLDDLPRAIAEKKRQGVFSDADAAVASVAKLYDVTKSGDPGQVVSFINGINATLPEKIRKPEAVSARVIQDPKTGEPTLVAMGADGQPVFQMAQSHMKRVADSLGKTDLKELKPGERLVGVKNGQASELYAAPESKSMRGQHAPAEVQTMEWLMEKGVAKNETQAWEMVRSAREKTRSAFVMDYVAKNAMPGRERDTASMAEKVYDSLQGGGGAPSAPQPGTGNPSRPAVPGRTDPRIKSLIGIP